MNKCEFCGKAYVYWGGASSEPNCNCFVENREQQKDYFKNEKACLDSIVKAYNLFTELDRQHPNELIDFTNAIHTCQYIIGMRIARKYEPEIFPIKNNV